MKRKVCGGTLEPVAADRPFKADDCDLQGFACPDVRLVRRISDPGAVMARIDAMLATAGGLNWKSCVTSHEATGDIVPPPFPHPMGEG